MAVAEKLAEEAYSLIEPRFERIGGRYVFRAFTGKDEVPLASIPGCTVDFKEVFETKSA